MGAHSASKTTCTRTTEVLQDEVEFAVGLKGIVQRYNECVLHVRMHCVWMGGVLRHV